jgi:hypothetical protein
MPRKVSVAEISRVIDLMLLKDSTDRFIYGQRDLERETGLSRPYIRKLARSMGHQFPRNGIEVVGNLCMCTNCASIFRRSKSKIDRAKNQFCDEDCKNAWMKGPQHPAWKTGVSALSFSSWIKNQTAYDDWRNAVLERDNYRCIISGRTDNLQAHHVLPKAEGMSPEKAFDVSNGITLNVEVHQRIHSLIKTGIDFQEAIEIVSNEYQTGDNNDHKRDTQNISSEGL